MSMSTPEHSPLGKTSAYIAEYDPTLLFPIERQGKRDEIGIDGSDLPFAGVDIWNAYELSWLNPKGKPVVALGEFFIPAQSPRLIESKSFKLYLNSFNQSHFASVREVVETMSTDLSKAAGAEVRVTLVPLGQMGHSADVFALPGENIDDLDIETDQYQTDPGLLATVSDQPVHEVLNSHLLKSNCLVRQHNEFHEQCVERIFQDLQQHCGTEQLTVYARYVRRGGLDINPYRSNDPNFEADNRRLVRQ